MKIKKLIDNRQIGLLGAIAVLLILAVFLTPSLFQLGTIHLTIRNYSVVGILVLGMMAVILTGGIDLSIGSELALSGMLTSLLMAEHPEIPVLLLIVIGVAVGLLCGLINGVLVGKLYIQPIIATLATMNIYRGATYFVSGGKWVTSSQYTDSFAHLSGGQFGLYNIIWFLLVLSVLMSIFLAYTKYGRRLYAVGSNEKSSRIAGIKASNIKILAYVIMGGLAGLAGILYSANYKSFAPNIGIGMEMDVIAICVLGGVSITGGRGNFKSVVTAFVMMTLVSAFLSMLPGMSLWTNALQGSIIIVAVIVNLLTERIAEKHALYSRKI